MSETPPPTWIPALREYRRDAHDFGSLRAADDEVLCAFRALVVVELGAGLGYSRALDRADKLLERAIGLAKARREEAGNG